MKKNLLNFKISLIKKKTQNIVNLYLFDALNLLFF